MLLRKSKKFKICSLVLAAVLSTCLMSCQSSTNSNDTSSDTIQESKTENKEQDNSKDTETKKDNKESEDNKTKESSKTMDADTMDYHSAQAVDNANKTHEGFEASDNSETAPEGKVYILQGSTKYHSKSICGDLNKGKCIDKNIAETAGYSPCEKCYK